MYQKYPKGYRRADERSSFKTLQEEEEESIKPSVPAESFDKLKKGTLAELKDPLRKSTRVIRKEEILDLQLDIYLFGKGADINQ